MADFTVVIAAGASVADWLDPSPDAQHPSRLNARPGHPHRRYVGTQHVAVVLKAVVGGTVGPADGTLGGRLFSAWVAECPDGAAPIALSSSAGFSSIQELVPHSPGHYTVGFFRPDGGIELVHLDVEAA